MNKFAKDSLAVILNCAFCTNQLLADLPPVTFDSAEWVPYQSVGRGIQPGWQLFSGDANVSGAGEGFNGGKALKIPANAQQESRLSRAVTWDAAETTAFIDLQVKPAADPVGSLATFYANGTQIAFQVPAGSSTGEIWVYHGEDGIAGPGAPPEQWIKTVGTFAVAPGAAAATNYIRVTLRHDYSRNLWDLFIGGKLAAANLAFEGRGANLASLEFYGSNIGDTLIDDLSAQTVNMLFPDADKDGLSDAWEIANGSNPNVYDRDAIKPGTAGSFLDSYLASLWPSGGVNGSSAIPASGGIPPLTIDAEAPHQSVGALKGSLSVGGDGSASYSVPIDLPKGTGGMEPKLSLGYSSGGGNGIMGVGWNLAGLQCVTRGPSSAAKDGGYDPVDFDASDRFFLDGERLVCIAGSYGAAGSVYRTEMDSFARITAIGAGPVSWKVETKAGLSVFLGETADSKTAVPAGTLSWGVNRVEDSAGNYYSVEYTRDAPVADFDFVNHRVSAIRYTGNASQQMAPYCTVEFSYEGRPDISRSYTPRAGYRLDLRLAKIRVLTGSYVNHSYKLIYNTSYQTGRSLVRFVQKLIHDELAPWLSPTYFNYDGLQQSTPLWQDPGPAKLPVYCSGLDATGEVNSMVTAESNGTAVRLTGDVARAYVLPAGGVTLYPDTRIQFQFKSSRQVAGALIGLDSDAIYHEPIWSMLFRTDPGAMYQIAPPPALYRIGGAGSINMASFHSFFGPTQPYTVAEGLKTFDLNIGQLGSGAKGRLILMCVDNESSDGDDDALFSNVRIYRSGTQQASAVAPVQFSVGMELPRFEDTSGKDLGVVAADFDADGLVDLADWRVTDYSVAGGLLIPATGGNVYQNTGGGFLMSDSLRPPASLPLGCRSSDTNATSYTSKHHLLAQPLDIDGDGNVDLMGSVNLQTHSGYLKNEYAFYTRINGIWTEKTAWKLPFAMDNRETTTDNGGKRRDEHFQWTDLNSDGYPDLVVHTTADGHLYDRTTGALILNVSCGIAYLNNGKNGGWTRDNGRYLPEPLMVDQKDMGRRLVDLDGDGIMEIAQATENLSAQVRHTYRMSATGTYLWNSTPGLENPPPSPYDLPTALTDSGSNNDRGVLLMDVNGDGLVDVVRSQKIDSVFSQQTWLNQGSRDSTPWAPETVPPAFDAGTNSYCLPLPLHYKSGSLRVPYGFEQTDLNGDGLVDILYSDIDNTFTPGADNLAILNTGNGWLQRPSWGLPDGYRIFNSSSEREAGKRRAKLLDVNGDGFPDLITGMLGETPRVWLNNCRPEVLKVVTDGFGSDLRVDYTRLNDPTPAAAFGSRVYQKWTDPLPAGQVPVIDSRLVVSRYSEPDGNGGRRYRSQRYGDLRYDRYNESSLGFGWIEAKDELNNQTTRTETRRDYPFGGSPAWTRTWVEVKPSDLSAALPGVTAGTKCLSEETATYGEMPSQTGTGGSIRRPVQTGSVKSLYDLTGTVVSRTTTTQNAADFDAYGFVNQSTVASLDGSTVSTANTYAHGVDATRWHLGRLSQSTVTKSGAGKPTLAKTASFTYEAATGLLKTETVEPGSALTSTKTYTRDGFGNVVATSVSGSGITRSGSSVYDPQGRFLLGESNPPGHTVSYNYDAQRALLLSTTDIARKTTTFGYDPHGTLVRTWHPDSTLTGESTGYYAGELPAAVAANVTNAIRYFRAKQSSGSPVAKVYLDAAGRELVAETTILRDAFATGAARYSKVYAVSQYDTLGRKIKISDAFGAGETPKFTLITYDVVGRVLKTTHPDGQSDQVLSFQSATLGGQPVSYSKVQNRNGGILERWENQHGRLVQSKDPSYQTTTFNHDQEGRLLNVAIDGDTLLTNTFDLLGNKTSVNEVNSGSSSSVYNALGEVTSSINAKGQSTSFTYDTLGRPLTIAKPEGTYTTSYDNASGSGLGKPWKTTGPGGYQEIISYDDLGRPRGTTKTQFGETFTTASTYDAMGRVLTGTDAGGLTVLHEYDPSYSFPVKLSIGLGSAGAGSVLWQAGTYDAKGRAVSQTLAQGVVASASYNATSGLPDSLNASQGGNDLQSKSYLWDTLGNLQSRTDGISGRVETFAYDHLNRVTQASVSGTGGPPVANHGYDVKGNLITKPGTSLFYGIRPHAVSAAIIKGAARAYAYDAAGYVTSDSKRNYTWTSFGQISSLDYLKAPALQNLAGTQIYAASRVETNFEFDAGGNRARQIKQRIAADDSRQLEDTLYLGSYEREIHETKATASASPVITRSVHRHSIGGFAVYTRTDSPATGSVTKLTTILKDHLGSTDVLFTGTWNGSSFASPATERQSFDPWGERRDPATLVSYRADQTEPFRASAQDYDRGYTGHEQLDDSGLIHMNGRLYDPELGRMLSPDPFVQVPEYSQNFNRYSYVMNNPLNLTDPSGFSFLDIFTKPLNQLGKWLGPTWSRVLVLVVQVVVTAVVSFYAGPQVGNAAGAAAGAGMMSALNGGGFNETHKAAGVAYLAAYFGGYVDQSGGVVAQAAGHGVINGAANEAMGGKFQDGFISGASSSALYSAGGYSGLSGYSPGITQTVVGGTVSVIGGGKFANGAKSAAFDYLITSTAQNGVEFYRDGGSSRRGTWLYPEGESTDMNKYYFTITNGILGNLKSFQDAVNRSGQPGYYNPSHGLFFDLVEVLQQKFFGSAGDPLTAGYAEGLAKTDHLMYQIGHSQGAATVMNSVLYYGIRASGLEFRSAAMGYYRAAYAAKVNGTGFTYNTPYFDIANLYTSINPLRMGSAILDPIIGTFYGYSSHSVHSHNGY